MIKEAIIASRAQVKEVVYEMIDEALLRVAKVVLRSMYWGAIGGLGVVFWFLGGWLIQLGWEDFLKRRPPT